MSNRFPKDPITTDSAAFTRPGLLLTIRGMLPSLNEQEQKVGQYVLDHPDEVIRLSMTELAQRCAVSDTTVFRFSRKVQVEGYQELKIRLALELEPGHTPTYARVTATDSPADAARKVIAADVKALEDTLSVLDFDRLEEAANVLLAARRVDIYGSGGGAIAALELQYKLMRVGVRAVPHTDAEMQVISATLLTSGDVAIAISHSGESEDLRHALELAKQAGARTIAITNHPASPLAEAADVSLRTAAEEALAHGYPLGARIAQVALIDVLFTSMAMKRQSEVEQSQERIARSLYRRPS